MHGLRSVLVFFVSLFCLPAFCLTIVSDLDDTIKITNVGSKSEAAYNGLFKTDAFTGMPELMQVFRGLYPENHKLFIVSGSPELVRGNVEKLMRVNAIQSDRIYLTNGSSKKDDVLKELVAGIDDEILLFGDDQEHDSVFYAELQALFPRKIRAVYIHQVNNQRLHMGQMGYLTAYEVALHEFSQGRINAEALEYIKKSVESAETKMLIPKWQKCSRNIVDHLLAQVRRYAFADQNALDKISFVASKNCKGY